VPNKPSIVVMPFDNLSHDPEQQYFNEGIADDIAADLSKVSGLRYRPELRACVPRPVGQGAGSQPRP
jgi:hypothetical protein